MKLAHVIVTMFCLRSRDMFRHVHGPSWGDPDPLRRRYVNYRLNLLETICLPSILAQSCRDFTWILLVDEGLDAVSREKLEHAVRPGRGAGLRLHLHEYRPGDGRGMEKLGWLEPYLAERPDRVVTTKCDSDDALPRRFVETVRAHAEGLAAKDALPPFQIMGMKQRWVFWDMAFSREAPLGWARDSRLPWAASCGFSLMSPWSSDIGVMGMRHRWAEEYFGNRPPEPRIRRHVELYRRWFREAPGPRSPTLSPSKGAFFDVSAAGGALMTNHAMSLESRLRNPHPHLRREADPVGGPARRGDPRGRKVTGAETFPDFTIDWDKLWRRARSFGRSRTVLGFLERKVRRRN